MSCFRSQMLCVPSHTTPQLQRRRALLQGLEESVSVELKKLIKTIASSHCSSGYSVVIRAMAMVPLNALPGARLLKVLATALHGQATILAKQHLLCQAVCSQTFAMLHRTHFHQGMMKYILPAVRLCRSTLRPFEGGRAMRRGDPRQLELDMNHKQRLVDSFLQILCLLYDSMTVLESCCQETSSLETSPPYAPRNDEKRL